MARMAQICWRVHVASCEMSSEPCQLACAKCTRRRMPPPPGHTPDGRAAIGPGSCATTSSWPAHGQCAMSAWPRILRDYLFMAGWPLRGTRGRRRNTSITSTTSGTTTMLPPSPSSPRRACVPRDRQGCQAAADCHHRGLDGGRRGAEPRPRSGNSHAKGKRSDASSCTRVTGGPRG